MPGMEPASTAGDGYIECNVFHMAPQKPLPALAVYVQHGGVVALGLWLRDVCGEDPQPGQLEIH